MIEHFVKVADSLGCSYTLKGAPITPEDAFAKTGVLPGLLRRAEQLSEFCLGHGLGLTFNQSGKGVMGVSVDMDDVIPDTLRIMCALDVLIEIIQEAPSTEQVALDGLLAS